MSDPFTRTNKVNPETEEHLHKGSHHHQHHHHRGSSGASEETPEQQYLNNNNESTEYEETPVINVHEDNGYLQNRGFRLIFISLNLLRCLVGVPMFFYVYLEGSYYTSTCGQQIFDCQELETYVDCETRTARMVTSGTNETLPKCPDRLYLLFALIFAVGALLIHLTWLVVYILFLEWSLKFKRMINLTGYFTGLGATLISAVLAHLFRQSYTHDTYHYCEGDLNKNLDFIWANSTSNFDDCEQAVNHIYQHNILTATVYIMLLEGVITTIILIWYALVGITFLVSFALFFPIYWIIQAIRNKGTGGVSAAYEFRDWWRHYELFLPGFHLACVQN